jgi:uncharacterized protein YcbK (DUF882 family)
MGSKLRSHNCSRRVFLCRSLQIALGVVVCQPFKGQAFNPGSEDLLSFYHTHTHETLTLDFNRRNDAQLLNKLNYFLRDFRTGDVHSIDSRLLDLLCRIKRISGSNGAFEVISGYRSPKTNKELRTRSNGVAKKSLHMFGQAIDVRLADLKTRSLRDIAWSLKKGGVGYYAQSDFVHLDTGRIRQW